MWTIDLREQQGLKLDSWATSTGGSGSLKGKDGRSFFIPAKYLSNGVKIFIYYETDPNWVDLPPTYSTDNADNAGEWIPTSGEQAAYQAILDVDPEWRPGMPPPNIDGF